MKILPGKSFLVDLLFFRRAAVKTHTNYYPIGCVNWLTGACYGYCATTGDWIFCKTGFPAL